MTLWGATAASALLLAVLSSRSEIGAERIAYTLSSLRGGSHQVAARAFDAKAETRKLTEAVHTLASENSELRARLAAVENHVDDLTGSIAKQIEAVKESAVRPPGEESAPSPQPPAVIGAAVPQGTPDAAPNALPAAIPPSPVAALTEPPPLPLARPAIGVPAEPGAAAAVGEFGVDIGSALSVQVLHARWLGIRSAHPQLFEGLTPIVVLREIPKSEHVELRLVVGPLGTAEAAAKLCAALAPYRLFCQPAAFDRKHVALQ